MSLLHRQIDDILKASDLLIEFTHTHEHDKRKEVYAGIKSLEEHCDRITEEITDELNKSFITPFDREDINLMASQLDDLLDLMTGSAKRVVLYNPREMHNSMVSMAEHIKKSAEEIKQALNELSKSKRDSNLVRQNYRNLHDLERSADDVYERFTLKLFSEEKDAIELMKQMDIMQMLENATDKAYRVGDVLKTIVVKYA